MSGKEENKLIKTLADAKSLIHREKGSEGKLSWRSEFKRHELRKVHRSSNRIHVFQNLLNQYRVTMNCEAFLKNLKDAAVFISLIAVADTIATNTARENNIAVLLGYAGMTASPRL